MTAKGAMYTNQCQISPSTGNYNTYTNCTAPATGTCINGYTFMACPRTKGLTFATVSPPTMSPTMVVVGSPTMTPTVAAIVLVQATQTLACATGCLISAWTLAQTKLMTNTLQTALYTSLNLAAVGGSANVTGFAQLTSTRRQLLTPSISAAYTVRINNPTVTATAVTSLIGTATTSTTFTTALAVATGSTVTASAPVTINYSPTGAPSIAPSKSAGASMHGDIIITVTLTITLAIGLIMMTMV